MNLNLVTKILLFHLLKGPFGPLLAPPEGLRAPGVDSRSQGVIPRRFKQKKFCDGGTDVRTSRHPELLAAANKQYYHKSENRTRNRQFLS